MDVNSLTLDSMDKDPLLHLTLRLFAIMMICATLNQEKTE